MSSRLSRRAFGLWALTTTVAVVALGTGIGAGRQVAGPNPTTLREHPAILYSATPAVDPVARLARDLEAGRVTLRRDESTGYLRSVLEALNVPPESQVLPFSKSSFQSKLIAARNPRALYFNDSVFVGYVRGSDVLEFASQDPKLGTVFHTLRQDSALPKLERNDNCVVCHAFASTGYVPGPFVSSVYPAEDGMPLYGPTFTTDHRSAFEQRWGGWYVTGQHRGTRHMGNAVVTNPADIDGMVTPATVHATDLAGRFDPKGYLSAQSDIVALLVLEHQTRMHSLLTRVGYEARIGSGLTGQPAAAAIGELVDYMLFVDEAALPGPISGPTEFSRLFQARGPSDGQGRSLRTLNLATRLLEYPCSFLVYSESFTALPPSGKDGVYQRLWTVLSGADRDARYAKLSQDSRRAIVEILKATLPDLPAFFDPAAVR